VLRWTLPYWKLASLTTLESAITWTWRYHDFNISLPHLMIWIICRSGGYKENWASSFDDRPGGRIWIHGNWRYMHHSFGIFMFTLLCHRFAQKLCFFLEIGPWDLWADKWPGLMGIWPWNDRTVVMRWRCHCVLELEIDFRYDFLNLNKFAHDYFNRSCFTVSIRTEFI